ncbi:MULTISPECIES: RNA recognition motif domain-containing protein [Butyricimonas]|uniref:RNA recognition motif domain-containing protein n=1 Tax=Butyricimonas TaxID=574697 RepID=UPI0007FB3F68|nr:MULTISPECIES: RNA-binding protein [Butyricimonas]
MNIYISNLSYDVTDADLKELFEEYGEVSSAKVIMDRETGRSRGFGFVEMPENEQGQKAIDELNQAEYDGKVISVNVAKPRTDRPAGNRGGGFNRGGGGGRDRRSGNGGGRSFDRDRERRF